MLDEAGVVQVFVFESEKLVFYFFKFCSRVCALDGLLQQLLLQPRFLVALLFQEINKIPIARVLAIIHRINDVLAHIGFDSIGADSEFEGVNGLTQAVLCLLYSTYNDSL